MSTSEPGPESPGPDPSETSGAAASAGASPGRSTAPRGFADEVRDAVTVRALLLVTGVLLLQLGFILSYIGAFHSPTPHRIPVAVVAPPRAAGAVAARLNGLDGHPVKARTAASEAQARRWLLDRTVDAAILIAPSGTSDTLLVASAGGPAVSSTAAQIAGRLESAEHRRVTVADIRPPAAGDGRGLSSFYLVLGWIVGGYLAAAILGVAGGARPASLRRTVIRLAALALYAVVSGLGGALIAGPVFGALTGHFLALWGIGALVVFAAAAATAALQILFGMIGIGVAILLFVVLGNPSAGGAYPKALLPAFWRAIGDWLPTGAATTAVRNVVYFSGHDTARAWWVLGAYAVAGTAVALGASAAHLRRSAGAAGARA
ncbi:DUF3533 domain-containing protein [Actinomadura roseirufa]|uniref:DUF3533 domain-containing protein n=1 Tax=Actinomadura roseirufa TaxID=2094049 RepID=UPI00104196DF|nr:DUF3533 domain-containing protein [Actinomadura roseirufa]